MIQILGGVFLGFVLGVLGTEFSEFSAWISPRIARRAARRLPVNVRSRYEEEWTAELASLGGLKLVKLVKASGIWISSFRVAAACRDETYVSLPTYIKRLCSAVGEALKFAWCGGDELRFKVDLGVVFYIRQMRVLDPNFDLQATVGEAVGYQDGARGGTTVTVTLTGNAKFEAGRIVTTVHRLTARLWWVIEFLHWFRDRKRKTTRFPVPFPKLEKFKPGWGTETERRQSPQE